MNQRTIPINLSKLGHVFDPQAELLISEQCRPHWAQAGAIVFVTFRTHDSIPKKVIERWELEKYIWLQKHGMLKCNNLAKMISQLSVEQQVLFHRHFDHCREDLLDNHLGRCALRESQLAQTVADALLHFDGQRYRLGDFIIMPNHVHLLCAFRDADSMRLQLTSWLHYTATQINRQLGQFGKFWQGEPFDHLIRSQEQYKYLRKYIHDNPSKAGVMAGEYLYRRYGEG